MSAIQKNYIFLNTGYMIKIIITPGTNFNVLKSSKMKNPFQHLKDACIYITTDDLDLRTELQDAIESESTGKKFSLRS